MTRFALQLVPLVACALLLSACGDFARKNVCLNASDPTCFEDELSLSDSPSINGPNPNFPDCNALATHPSGDSCQPRLSTGRFGEELLLNEAFLNPVGPNTLEQKVELWNIGHADIDLSGWSIMSDDASFTFGENARAFAGQYLVVHLSIAGSDDAFNSYAPAFPELSDTNGELALVSPNGAIVDYVQWGQSGHAHESHAVQEGQWVSGQACVAPVEGYSLSYHGYGDDADAFTARLVTLGSANDLP